MSALRSKDTRNYRTISGSVGVGGTGGSTYISEHGPFKLTIESVWGVRGGFDRIRYSTKRVRGNERTKREKERKRIEMKFNSKNFRFEMLLESPLWLLALTAILVTVSVIASAVAL